jgi:hypothetical protein
VGDAFLSFLEVVRRGDGLVAASRAGWLVPRDGCELAVLDAVGAAHDRLAGWVRDDVTDHIAQIAGECMSAKMRDRIAELTRYYLRPISTKRAATRATLSNWRRDAASQLADYMHAPHDHDLSLTLRGLPAKGERWSLQSLARDPAVAWILELDPQERDVAIYRALADAAAEAKLRADARALIGVALIASRLAPGTNPEPAADYDGTPLRGLDGRKFTRSRLALPLVLQCLHRSALLARHDERPIDTRAVLLTGQRLLESTAGPLDGPGPLANLDTERAFDPDLLTAGIAYGWQKIFTHDAQSVVAVLVRHAALASGMVSAEQQQDLALLSMAVARWQSDRHALRAELHRPTFRSDTAGSILFQLRFRRERLLLASHHNPGRDWRRELTGISDLLAVRKDLLSADDARDMEKINLHLLQGIHLRQARDITAAGMPMDTVPMSLTDEQIRLATHAVDDILTSLQDSFRLADEDGDETTAVNAHRRKTEAEGVVHLLNRLNHPDALEQARRLQRNLNRLDDTYLDDHPSVRSDVAVLWLLAMADQALRRNETEQARHYLTAAVNALPDGIPHLAIRSANVAASIGDIVLAQQMLERVPAGHTWPSYLRHLAGRLTAIDK